MKLGKLGTINHGLTISRITAKPNQVKKEIPLFTIQDLNNEVLNQDFQSDTKTVSIDKNNFDENLLSKENMVVIGLTVHKAYVIEKHHEGKVIPSNFAYTYLDESLIDANYFAWYFNEHINIKKQLQISIQGSMGIMALPVNVLRELEIDLPSIQTQKRLGQIYKLRKLKEKKLNERNDLEKTLFKQIMINKLKEEI